MSWSSAASPAAVTSAGAAAGVEEMPAVAADVFGDRLALAQRYAALLCGPGITRGLLGPREGQRVWSRHLLNCAVVVELIPAGAVVADLGSGAGLPGVVLALLRPDLEVTLVEPMARRCEFLDEVLGELTLDRVKVRRGRAEDPAGTLAKQFDVVVARAVADLSTLHGWARPLLRPGGRLLAMKGARADEEIAQAAPALRRDGVTAAVRTLGVGRLVEPTTVVVVGAGVGSTGPIPGRAAP